LAQAVCPFFLWVTAFPRQPTIDAGTYFPSHPSMASDVALQIDGLQTRFRTEDGDLAAVNGVSLTLKRGTVLAIVGESGCGKTVTAYSILRLIQPPGYIAGGRILFHPRDGSAPIDLAALDAKADLLYRLRGGYLSMIFQEPMSALSPVHTVGNQLCEAVLIHQDKTPAQARALAIDMLNRVGIPAPERRIDQYPHELSGGMRQRVVIAMALICRPEVLIADEPTTALDVTIQAQILKLIRDLRTELGTSVIFITHDLGVVAQVADEVAVMYLGRVVERGTVRQVLKSPLHPYTARLLKSLPGQGGRTRRLPTIEGSVPSMGAVPRGCPFHPRCPHAEAGLCDEGPPPALRMLAGDHQAACLRLDEIARETVSPAVA